MGDFYTNPVRHPEDTGIGHIRRTITLAQFSAATGGLVPIGALESGSVPLPAHANIDTAFNAGTTNVMNLGTTADDDAFAATAGILAGAAGFKPSLVGAESGKPLAADTIIYAKYAQTGTAATTGKVTFILPFVNKREVTGTPWPQN